MTRLARWRYYIAAASLPLAAAALILVAALVVVLSGCTSCPSGEQPVYNTTTHATVCQH